jgi:predicted ATPase
MVVKGGASPEVVRAFTRALELCELVGDTPESFPALWGQWHVHLMRAELRTAYELAGQLLQRAENAHDLLYAHNALGETSFYMGKFFPAREHFETAISLYDPERTLDLRHSGFDAGVNTLSTAALNLWTLGYPDQALKKGNEALALAQQLSHPYSLAFAEVLFAVLHQYRREVRSAQETAEGAIALCAEHGSTADVLAIATILHGWAMAAQGRHEEGIAQLQEGLAAYRKVGAELGRPYFVGLLAEACLATGRLDDGLSALTPTRGAEMHRLKGELLLRQDDSGISEAPSCFQRAIEIAREQGAKSLELRATTSLARLLAKEGNRTEARTMLAEIYNWFTEGFDTADLKDAKALLDELVR